MVDANPLTDGTDTGSMPRSETTCDLEAIYILKDLRSTHSNRSWTVDMPQRENCRGRIDANSRPTSCQSLPGLRVPHAVPEQDTARAFPPFSNFPPGNSHNLARFSPRDRRASKTQSFLCMIAASPRLRLPQNAYFAKGHVDVCDNRRSGPSVNPLPSPERVDDGSCGHKRDFALLHPVAHRGEVSPTHGLLKMIEDTSFFS
jgi:hypothetical protein